MKKLVVIMLGVLLIGTVAFTGKGDKKTMKPVVVRTLDGSEVPTNLKTGVPANFSEGLRLIGPGDSIGFTYYDYPTNGCAKKNIFTFETGEIYVIRMARSNDWTNGPNNRGSYAAFFDGADWSAMMGPIEGAAKGFTDAGVYDDGRGWSVAHTGNVHTVDLAFGAMNWTPQAADGNAGIWPTAASVGNDTIFYVSSLSGGAGTTSGMIFMRSFDGGTSWSNPYRLDSAVANPFGLELRTAEGYNIDAFHNYVAAVQASYTVTGVPENYLGAINLYESFDYGTTWTRRLINPAITPEPVPNGTREERAYIDPFVKFDMNGKLHVFWSTLTRWVDSDAGADGYYFTDDNKIMHWSEATGATVAASLPAGTAGVNIDNNDVNVGYQGIPAAAFDADGNVFVIYNRVSEPSDTDAAGFIYYQLYGVASPNNGATWYAPVNITQTVGYDNHGASIAPYVLSDNKLYITYLSDPFTGNEVQGGQLEEIPAAIMVHSFPKTDLLSADTKEPVAKNFNLKQNYPNPFNPSTTIEYDVKNTSNVTLKVYNMLGQEVRSLVNSRHNAGTFKVQWDGKDNAGKAVASGVYMYRLEAGDVKLTKKMMFLK